ncbi:YjbQ family protein [Glaciecola sp. XM2]|nr:YjbQ family protein [Glaciecola sp. XM2]
MGQFNLTLSPRTKGFHLITDEVLDACGSLADTGLMHVFIQHTSASLTINENAVHQRSTSIWRIQFTAHFSMVSHA